MQRQSINSPKSQSLLKNQQQALGNKLQQKKYQPFSKTQREEKQPIIQHTRSKSKEIVDQAEDLQTGQCKLIFLPEFDIKSSKSDLGFTTFTEMMKSNTSWMSQAPKLNSSKQGNLKLSRLVESPDVNVHGFPQYLSNRLEFNKSQTVIFQQTIQQKWTDFFDESTMNSIRPNYRREPKVKMLIHDVKNLDDSKDQEYNQQEKHELDAVHMKLRNLKFFWYTIQATEQWKPANREGCTMTFIESSHKCILYGGIGRELFNNFVSLNTKNWNWQDLGPGSGDIPQQGRFGHSANLYKKGIVIYGGEKKYNSAMRMRECYSDVCIYYPHNQNWVRQRTFGNIAEGRRNHCAVICGKFLFLLGGVNSYGKYLRDIYSLNLDSLKWADYEADNFYSQGIAFASAVSLFKSDIKMDNPNSPYELLRRKGKRFLKLGHEGIFIFGGRLQSGEAVGDLRVLMLGSSPLQVKKVESKGVGPSPRYMHSMDYYENQNFCVIYGGRDDSVTKEGPQNIKNDLFIIEMHQFNWISVQQFGIPNSGKCSHSSVFLGSKLMIFGGYSASCLNNSDLQFVEIDQEKTRQMIKDSKTKQTGNSDAQHIFTIKEIQEDLHLKVLTTGTAQQAQINPQLLRVDNPTMMQKNASRQSYSNFVSFQPLPLPETSALMKEFQQKKDQDRMIEMMQQRADSRRNSVRSKNLEPLHQRNGSELFIDKIHNVRAPTLQSELVNAIIEEGESP